MAYFAISYDLVAQNGYKPLFCRLEELGAVKTQLSFWLVKSNNTAQEVKNDLEDFIDDNDRLMVIEFSKRPRFNWGFKGTRKWIEDRF
ncbi:CRISPR-associated protein Cas2 [Ruegeria atlantica]|uniref:CRISPR-associated protein Cas2 n=1 Tax=Ruegeria atlantica TaxID=81569 RepID=UPI0014800EEE|nr:CRISPR-associated protein Cas2 [Ruegeria atlantica]